MIVGKTRRRWNRSSIVGLALVALLGAGSASGVSAQAVPGSYDTLRIENGGTAVPYRAWVEWAPLIVPLPDGGAWAFFSAQEKQADGTFGTKRLYGARFDSALGVWTPATRMPGGAIQFGPAAAVDAEGVVHLVYTDRAEDADDSFGTLVYTTSDGNGGWVDPVAVAESPDAGHQLSPSLVIDGSNGLHVVWQDQRAVDPAKRGTNAAFADIFGSDLVGGAWSEPVQISQRATPETNASRPQLATDGDRLIVTWSNYDESTGLDSATLVEWSTRPLDNAAAWAPGAPLIEKGESQIGGRLVDIASNPQGGAVLVYGRRTNDQNELVLRRLDRGAEQWGENIALGQGDRGGFPSLTVAGDGTTYVAYNMQISDSVHVGAVAVAADATAAGAEVVLSQGEEFDQGRPVVATDAANRLWAVYFHSPVRQGAATDVRILRGAPVPVEPAAAP